MRELMRVLRLIRPEWPWVLLGIVLSLFTVLANVGLLALASWFIASMAIAGAAHITMDFTLPSAGVRGLALGRTGGRYLERMVNHNTTFRVLARVRIWFFEQLEPLAPAGLSRYRSGDLLSRIRADIDILDDFYVRAFVPVITASVAVVAISLFIAGYSTLLMVIDLIALGAGGVLLPLLLMRLGTRPGGERVTIASDLRSLVVDAAQGAAELIAFGAVEPHAARAVELSAELTQRERRLSALEGGADGGIILASGLATWGGAILLVPMVTGGLLAPQDIAMLSVLLLASFETIMPLPTAFRRLGEMAQAARRLFEIIDASPAVSSREPPRVAPSSLRTPDSQSEPRRLDSELRVSTGRGATLTLRNLRFRYSSPGPWVLDDLTFTVRTGKRVAVVGPTGSGKSTLVNLLLRFWDYDAGSIRIDGAELKTLSGDQARRLFSVAEQSPFLFHTTIRENLLIAAPKASDEELYRCLDTVQLGEFIGTLNAGLDTIVGESGLKLSSGQRRRLSVGRALLKPSPILILDEPTEGLDDRTADALLAAIDTETAGRTIIVVSHRRRDLAFVDQVVRMRISL